ncbi:MAG: ACT domain-containing protein [Candidatus Abyssobacteria bacterium SURF_5]|uniref:ACT domain-containing protein n=1 Tax=Abyssobacteria bacterium (strain SURF_5) TaxID=2093360 RepID=A0A3A4NWR5_ABYX5|nr:MAG: ACT domain-containing protein [Candidatus Abyssubacteria bacterium SURF_5]
MKKYMILFLVGKDRPGIVDEVSSFLFTRGANIEDSRMAAMGGRFSIMTLFSCPEEHISAIRGGIPELAGSGFEVSLHEADDPALLPHHPELPLRMEVIAMDHPGIVQRVVAILHRHNVNIHSLETKVTSAPLSGTPLFDLLLDAAVPAEESIVKVKEELSALAADMNLDLSFL